jgi:CheY-like chemotaxis protein
MMKILIVEDVELNVDLLVQILEDEFALEVANDGAAGVEAARAGRPDLILMDMSLPKLDGWEATRRLKADRATAHIPVIALTAHAMQGDRERALACGCADYVSKPIDEDILFATIRRLVQGAAA